MKMVLPILYTKDIPKLATKLEEELPSIFASICFNQNKQPFQKEVQDTEIGHLFEHILLEYLCLARLDQGVKNASFEGETVWDWTKNPAGTFQIYVSVKKKEKDILKEALSKTFILFNSLLKEVSPSLQSGYLTANWSQPLS